MAPEADTRMIPPSVVVEDAPDDALSGSGRTATAASPRAARPAFDAPLAAWFATLGWRPLPFQRRMWRHYLRGESGLLHTPTGSGKTLAAFGGPLLQGLRAQAREQALAARREQRRVAARVARGLRPTRAPRSVARERSLRILWITPLKALAADTVRALREPIAALGLDWQVALRTGDASARDRRLARSGKVEVLVTTPESLSLLLSYPDSAPQFAGLQAVIVDEWHELLGNKRGVLLQLALARLRAIAPAQRTWGLSATLGNLPEARDVLLPHRAQAPLVSGVAPRTLTLESLVPGGGERFPWAGHLGLSQLQPVMQRLLAARTSLLFTNTRSQAELWHQALSAVWPEDPATLALHHGSLDPTLRAAAEQGLRAGSLRCVVSTSSLDLGVDFPAVDQVLQVGSPKGVARLLQRAGRAKHRPGEAGHVVCVPTHALELVEYAAVRRAIAHGAIEARRPPRLSLDVLAQHCVTLALGGGFEPAALLAEVRETHAFAALDAATWNQVLDFIVRGGQALQAYPEYCRVEVGEDGVYRVLDRRVAFRHRLSIGTITSDGSVSIKLLKGGRLGSVEEGFVARLRRGDRFQFAGRMLELVRLEDMTAYVRLGGKGKGKGTVPRWQGGRLPLSAELGRETELAFLQAQSSPELRAIAPLLRLQATRSALPAAGRLLVELVTRRDGMHLFVYPFAGRAVHDGLAALLALRWGRREPNSFSFASNDYGFVLSPAQRTPVATSLLAELLAPDRLLEDLLDGLNVGELSRRQFREIARVAGLLPPNLPGRQLRSMRQLQASSGLLYDVLARFDPGHLLLGLAAREVLESQLEFTRLAAALAECAARDLLLQRPVALTPLAFPLWAETMRGHLSTEAWSTRVRRAAEQLERRDVD
jgi:ATP-dependent Lhr-like helicase